MTSCSSIVREKPTQNPHCPYSNYPKGHFDSQDFKNTWTGKTDEWNRMSFVRIPNERNALNQTTFMGKKLLRIQIL